MSDINETYIFLTGFQKILISNFMKIRPVGAKFLRADRRMDRQDEVNSRFSQFCECALEIWLCR